MNFKEYNHQTRLEENDHQEIKFKNDFFIRIKLLVRSIRRIQKRFIILNLLSILILISLIYLSLNSKPTKIKFETLQNKFSSSFSIEHQNNLLKPITREVLEKLNLLQNKLNQEDYQDDHPPIDQSNQKMPMVTSLPTKPSTGTHSSVSNNHLNIPAEELDRSICPNQTELGLPCSFLLPGFIGEQETKAQIHLHQLGLLAIQLNRTLVLPNVSKSRMGTCLNYPFDLYYQLESLNSLGIPTISYVEFINWTLNRFPYPTAQLVSILDSKIDHSDRTLVKVETNSIETNLMIENLTPYISIHWRQETLPIENLIKCSKSLIPKLLKIKKSFPSLNSIYFSTDYPIEEILNHKETFIAHSGTFSKLITSEHHLLMKRLIQEFKEIETDLNLFSFHQILNQMSLTNELIEKLIKLPNVIELIKLNKLIPNQKEKKPNLKQIVIEALNQLDLENRVKIIEQSRGGIMDTDDSQWEKVEMKEMKEKVLNVVEFWDAD
ncbi:hypothetical protein DFH28DRAFT_1096239 [Melampsora americana]|nr:hypothetical protein DFH28DRAFT_1096239 [Melampsora americana]